tara:strand:+ start:32230 stop:33138 length:909 start_codon:yes stop_codon:yes gene_type:complete
MGFKIDGKRVAKDVEQRLIHEINLGIDKAGRQPGLAVIRVGDDPASAVYVKNKEKACSRIGVKSFGFNLDVEMSRNNLLELIYNLNEDEKVDGILLQLPLPDSFHSDDFLNAIRPDKDADGLHPLNLGKLLKGDFGPRSCTPAGVMSLLKNNKISLEGKRAVVIGRSILVGQPMALMLQAANATVTVAHSRTGDLAALTKEADLLVVAAGKPNLIDANYVKNDSVVIDVGIHRIPCKANDSQDPSYKLCGDVNLEQVFPIVSAITPVPGGVGPMTVAMLLVNTVSMWQQHCDLKFTLRDLLP